MLLAVKRTMASGFRMRGAIVEQWGKLIHRGCGATILFAGKFAGGREHGGVDSPTISIVSSTARMRSLSVALSAASVI